MDGSNLIEEQSAAVLRPEQETGEIRGGAMAGLGPSSPELNEMALPTTN
jgi:hypothetical protein